MNNPLISVNELSVNYGDFRAIEAATFKINNDDFIGVIGPNGGGKTTLIKAILKVIKYHGSVTYSEGLESNGPRRIGYMPQINTTDKSFPISVIDVVLSGLQSNKGLFKKYNSSDINKAKQLLKLCDINNLENKSIAQLSGGEYQRVMLCRAIISDPLLLILDEPNNFVDNKFESELYGILKELNKRMAIMVVSHDLGTISTHIKSVLCVNRKVHYHNSNIITAEQLHSYSCPIQLVSHGDIPHTVLKKH